MSTDWGEPAFPVIAENGLGHVSDGMTMWDWYAAHAPAELFINMHGAACKLKIMPTEAAAKISAQYADAMMAERRKRVNDGTA